jgi:hypothetical protein
LLEGPGHIVQLEVGGGLDLVGLLVVGAPRLELSRLKVLEFLSDENFDCHGAPNEANVGLLTGLHHIKGGVNCFFLSNKHKHDLECASFNGVSIN